MDRNIERLRRSAAAMAVSGVLMIVLGSYQRGLALGLLRIFGRRPQGLAYLMRTHPEAFLLVAALAVLALVFLVSLIRCVAAAARLTQTSSGSARNRVPSEEHAIGCAHKNGREKYLERIEGYLQSGMIDRAEYRALRERYEKMDIPDDYH